MQLIKFGVSICTLLLLAAIAWVSLAGSPFMVEIPWIPDVVAKWADGNPNFRNFPAFGLFSASAFAAVYFMRQDESKLMRTALFCALAAIFCATLFELLQLALPRRTADWRDVLWAALGALTGSFTPALLVKLFRP